jgi:Protein of unknown function (DUF998)
MDGGKEGPREVASEIRNGSLSYRLLLSCGIVGSLLFTAVYLIEGATRTGYNAIRDAISPLALGPGGWVQTVNFIVYGLFIGGYAFALRTTFRGSPVACWVPRLLLISAFGLILNGIFTTDPTATYPPGSATTGQPSMRMVGHIVGTSLSFIALPLACFLLVPSFIRNSRWRGWAVYSVATAIGMLALGILSVLATPHNGPAGLFEKLSFAVVSLWNMALAFRILVGVPAPTIAATDPTTPASPQHNVS